MGMIVATVFIAVPPAFLLGWILSKVLFRHLALAGQAAAIPLATAQPRSAAQRTQPALQPHGSSANTGDTGKYEQLVAERQGLKDMQQKLAAAQAETRLLKEAAVEREHANTELLERLKAQPVLPEESSLKVAAADAARHKQMLQAMHDRLATHEKRIEELKHELEVADTKAKRTGQHLHNWRLKFKPLARKFRQQRLMINELREEMRQRDVEQRMQEALHARALAENAAQQAESPKAPVAAAAPYDPYDPCVSGDTADYGDEEREDLQALRGIGPALHKKLNEKGVYRLKQLAVMDPQELRKLGNSLGMGKKQINRNNWTAQARKLLNMPAVTETRSHNETADA